MYEYNVSSATGIDTNAYNVEKHLFSFWSLSKIVIFAFLTPGHKLLLYFHSDIEISF